MIGVDASPCDDREGARGASAPIRASSWRSGDLLELELDERGRRDLLERHLPLDPRSRAPLRAPVRGAAARRAAGGAMRRAAATSAEIQRVVEALAGRRALLRLPRGPSSSRGISRASATPSFGSQRAGFETERVWLKHWPVTPRDPRGLPLDGDPALAPRQLPEDLHGAFLDAVLGGMPRPLIVEYVRLNISARRPA